MNYPFNYLLLVALVSMPVLLLLLRKMALKSGLVDIPNARKIHADAVPLVGGLALFVISIVLLLLLGDMTPFEFYLMLASGLVMTVGLFPLPSSSFLKAHSRDPGPVVPQRLLPNAPGKPVSIQPKDWPAAIRPSRQVVDSEGATSDLITPLRAS